MAIVREERIGDCRLSRKQYRAAGHKQALKLFPNIGPCEKCGDENTERHHIDDDPQNNSPENIMALCRRCHTLEHGKTLTPEAIAKGNRIAAENRKALTHCRRGHPYSGENLYISREGKRHCKECNRIAKRKYRAGGGRG